MLLSNQINKMSETMTEGEKRAEAFLISWRKRWLRELAVTAKRKGLTQQVIADGVKCHRPYVTRLLSGNENVTLDMYLKFKHFITEAKPTK